MRVWPVRAVVALLSVVAMAHAESPAAKTLQSDDEGPAEYIVRTVAASAGSRERYKACLVKQELPFWKDLHARGKVAATSVFETQTVLSAGAGLPDWNFLLMSHISRGSSPREVMKLFKARFNKVSQCDAVKDASLKRLEFMRTTPRANYAREGLSTDVEAQNANAEYIVEYIAVRDTPEDLARYRSIMADSIGPAMPALIRDGWQLNFVALETVSVRYSEPGMPSWNQIHVGLYPLKGSDAEQQAAMDTALRAINPVSGGYEGVYGPLPSYRTKPREDRVTQLQALAVH